MEPQQGQNKAESPGGGREQARGGLGGDPASQKDTVPVLWLGSEKALENFNSLSSVKICRRLQT